MIPSLDYLTLERSDIQEKDLKENQTYENVLRYQVTFSCIGKKTGLWIRNGEHARRDLGIVKIISVTHFPELNNGKIYTLVKYEITKLKKDETKNST